MIEARFEHDTNMLIASQEVRMVASNKKDPRVIKTRTSLYKALVYLLQREKLSNISVQKITETARVTRGTFYLHYKDKQDFVESAINSILNEFFDSVLIKQELNSDDNGPISVQAFSLRRAFEYIEDNAETFDVLLNNKKNEFFYERMYNSLADKLAAYYHQLELAGQVSDEDVPLRIQIALLDSAIMGLISHWLKDGLIYTPRYMTTNVVKMLNGVKDQPLALVNFFVSEEPMSAQLI